MKEKLLSIDIFSYFFRLFFLLLIGVLVVFLSINIYSFCELVFSSLERRLCIYKSISESNNVVSDFLINHYYNVFGSKSYLFLDDSEGILGISIFLKAFEIFKYLYFIIIGFFSFKLINNYSKNNVYNHKTNKNLLIISILIILLPFIYLIRDYIGCLLINKLPIKEPTTTFSEFKVYYLIIGLTLLFTYLFNNSYIKNSKYNLIFMLKRLSFVLFIGYFIYLSIDNISSLVNVIKLDKESLTYHELTKVKDSFIVVLVNNGFEIFGKSWTYLGLNTNLEVPMIIYYSSNILINLLFIYYCLINIKFDTKEFDGNYFKNNFKLTFSFLGIIVLELLLEMIVMIVVISIYKNYEYYNKNLEYGFINYEYLFYIGLLFIVFITSLTYKEIEKK